VSDEKNEGDLRPVMVIESIPARGEHKISEREIKREGIPTPSHLVLYPELGRGGMGRIHPATDRNLLRHVALKRLDKELSKVPMYRDGFIAEAQMTGQLEHPNIVPVHELAVDPSGVPYFTMKLVQGKSLDRWIRHPSRPLGSHDRLEDSLEVFIKVCDAIAYAHHRGVVHRDIKPENIMVAAFGQVYVMDWGLARLTIEKPASGARSQMNAKGPVGTPAYMSPEQAVGDPSKMDDRSDVFGLGALLYEMITGICPYGDEYNPDRIIELAKKGAVIPIEQAARGFGVSARLAKIVMKALAFRPEDRYQTVVDLQKDVRDFLRGGLHLPRKLFHPGETIIREGEVGDTAYMIISGTCRAYRTVDGDQETLAEMGVGDVFGEVALLLDEPRAASVEAVDKVTVLLLDKATMTEGLGLDGWTGALVHALATRFRDLEQQIRRSGMRRGSTTPPKT
jgi:serine/threonine-protein kinase